MSCRYRCTATALVLLLTRAVWLAFADSSGVTPSSSTPVIAATSSIVGLLVVAAAVRVWMRSRNAGANNSDGLLDDDDDHSGDADINNRNAVASSGGRYWSLPGPEESALSLQLSERPPAPAQPAASPRGGATAPAPAFDVAAASLSEIFDNVPAAAAWLITNGVTDAFGALARPGTAAAFGRASLGEAARDMGGAVLRRLGALRVIRQADGE